MRVNAAGDEYEAVAGTIPGQLWMWDGTLSRFTLTGPSDGESPVWDAGSNEWTFASSSTGLSTVRIIGAPDLDDPNNSNWPVNSIAPIAADTVSTAISVRRFDDTVDDGVGFDLPIPSNATNLSLRFIHRAQTAPGAVATVGLDLYVRANPNAAFGAAVPLTSLSVPASTAWVDSTLTLTLASLGATAGEVTQFELVRNGGSLTGDWTLAWIVAGFT